MSLEIKKPRFSPIPIQPWLFRYLTGNEMKVVSAILNYADMKDRTKNSFPTNRTILFWCGFDLIEKSNSSNAKNTTYEKYKALKTEEERTKFKNEKIKYGINTVKAIKRSLIEKGILKTEIVGKKGKQSVKHILDLEWKKEQYINEYDEYFNSITPAPAHEKEEIKKELENLLKVADNVSQDSLTNKLKELYEKSKDLTGEKSFIVPSEDIDKVTDFIMDSNRVKTKIQDGKISNKEAYKKAIKHSIENGTYNGIEETYTKLVKKEKEEIFSNLETALMHNEPTVPYMKNILNFGSLRFTNNIYIAKYINSSNSEKIDFIIGLEKIKNYVPTATLFTKENKELLENYEQSLKDYIEKPSKKNYIDETEKLEKLNEKMLNHQISKDKQKEKLEDLSQANKQNQILDDYESS
ncbi:hypothetical protein O8C76_00035 [Aliarcobacter butzleri]|uniref:Uncharacterized protein n=1 Tax=Aliarcobacter butzleri TaxID=28197 RepID=A0AAW7PTV9_9BACT|nr:hypothetical protein [Aliarcobacter butzleri]MDN5069414.1 hypothetical protein [Aliarcobacter butzleri]